MAGSDYGAYSCHATLDGERGCCCCCCCCCCCATRLQHSTVGLILGGSAAGAARALQGPPISVPISSPIVYEPTSHAILVRGCVVDHKQINRLL